MSKIYIIKDKSNSNKITFIKKYHKYKPFLSFLPDVLADMVFDYVNDVFEICIEKTDSWLCVQTLITLNYEAVMIHFVYWPNLISIQRLTDVANVIFCPCSHSCRVAYFMKKYYNQQIKLIDPMITCHSFRCKAEYFDKIIRHIDNHRHYKNEIIIIQLTMDYLKKNELW